MSGDLLDTFGHTQRPFRMFSFLSKNKTKKILVGDIANEGQTTDLVPFWFQDMVWGKFWRSVWGDSRVLTLLTRGPF